MESPFFSGRAQKDVPIRNYQGKSPLFYRNAHIMGAVFTADLLALEKALPPGEAPVRIWPGRGLAAIHCMEYKDTDIGPYNEVSLSIPLRRGSLGHSLWSRSYHSFIAQLPVTTEVALFGGLDYFNYPKYLASISFKETASTRLCSLRDPKTQELIMEFEGSKLLMQRPQPSAQMTLNTYPRKDGRVLHARLLINQLARRQSFLRDHAAIRFGPHPLAAPFKVLGLGRPLHYLFAPECESILFAPEAL